MPSTRVEISLDADEALLIWALFQRWEQKNELAFANVAEVMAASALAYKLLSDRQVLERVTPQEPGIRGEDFQRHVDRAVEAAAARVEERSRDRIPPRWLEQYPVHTNANVITAGTAFKGDIGTTPRDLGVALAQLADYGARVFAQRATTAQAQLLIETAAHFSGEIARIEAAQRDR